MTKRIELPEDDYARLLKLAESAAGLQVENRHLVQELQNSGTMLWRLRREAEDTEERLHLLVFHHTNEDNIHQIQEHTSKLFHQI